MTTHKNTTLLLSANTAQERAVSSILGHDTEALKCSEMYDYERLGHVDLVVGEPKMYAEDEQASDDGEFIFAVDTLNPRLFVLEAARGFSGPRHIGWLKLLVADLEDLGYDVGWKLLTLDGRKRVVILGTRKLGLFTQREVTFNAARLDGSGAETIANIITENLR